LAYLFDKGYAPFTMITYNSAISYVHKLNGLIDPANSVFIQKMFQGAKKTRVRILNRDSGGLQVCLGHQYLKFGDLQAGKSITVIINFAWQMFRTKIVTQLMDSSLAESTRKLYNKVWLELTIFCTVQLHEQDSHPPISISTLSLFLTYLFNKGYAP
jgi:hypothetical protein